MPVYQALGTSAGATVRTGQSSLLSLSCTNLNASVRYLQLFDRTGGPFGAPLISYPVYALVTGAPGFLVLDQRYFINTLFATGLTWGFSSSPTTYSSATAADCIFEMRYA